MTLAVIRHGLSQLTNMTPNTNKPSAGAVRAAEKRASITIQALKDIIAECPEPKLPYGKAVKVIAEKALREVGE